MEEDSTRSWTRAIASAEAAGPDALEACLVRCHATQLDPHASLPLGLVVAVRNGLSAHSHVVAHLPQSDLRVARALAAAHVALRLVNSSHPSKTIHATASLALATGILLSHAPHIHPGHALLPDLVALRAASLRLLYARAQSQRLQRHDTILTLGRSHEIYSGFFCSALLTNLLTAYASDDATPLLPYLIDAVDAHLTSFQRSPYRDQRVLPAIVELGPVSTSALLLAITQSREAASLEYVTCGLARACLRLASISGTDPAPQAQLSAIVRLLTEVLSAACHHFGVSPETVHEPQQPPSRLQALLSQSPGICFPKPTLPEPFLPQARLQRLAAAALVAAGLVYSQEGQAGCPALGPFLAQALGLLQRSPDAARMLLDLVPCPELSDAGYFLDGWERAVTMHAPGRLEHSAGAPRSICIAESLQRGGGAVMVADCAGTCKAFSVQTDMEQGLGPMGGFPNGAQCCAPSQGSVNCQGGGVAVSTELAGAILNAPWDDASLASSMHIYVPADWPGLQQNLEHTQPTSTLAFDQQPHQSGCNHQQSARVCLPMARSRWASCAAFMATVCAATLPSATWNRSPLEAKQVAQHQRCTQAAAPIASELCCAETADVRTSAAALLSALIASCIGARGDEVLGLLVLQCTCRMLAACPDTVPAEEIQQLVGTGAAAPLSPPTILAICRAAAERCRELLVQGRPILSVCALLEVLMVVVVHADPEVLEGTLGFIEGVWEAANAAGNRESAVLGYTVFRHLTYCHDHRKKTRTVRWYCTQLLRFNPKHADVNPEI